MGGDFTTIPYLDHTLLTTGRKDEFIAQLRHAVINVGFMYLAHPPVDRAVVSRLLELTPKLFEIPQEKKDALRMVNSPHFLGYSKLGVEFTKGATDQREQFDFATQFDADKWELGEPEFLRLQGESQWPDEEDLPGFRETMESYLTQLESLSSEFTTLLAEALGLPPTGLSPYFRSTSSSSSSSSSLTHTRIQHRSKIVKYPAREHVSSSQGVGPHFDAGFLTLLLQASPHDCLQVQAPSGAWVPAPPLPDTLVVNFGKGLETVTRGLAKATSHRVVSPPVGSGPRYSIPFFQRISQKIRLTDHIPEFDAEILALKDRTTNGPTDSVNYTEYEQEPSGLVELIGRIKSHPDVAERHYPTLFNKFFPEGLPIQGTAY